MKKGGFLMLLGTFLLLAALALTAYNIYDERRAGQDAEHALVVLQSYIPTAPSDRIPQSETPTPQESLSTPPAHILDPQIEMPVREVEGSDYIGILSIPSISLELPILSAWSDAALKLAPARFYGSVYTDDMVIAGHNYDTHFGRIPKLPIGESVVFTDMEGNVFTYRVSESLVLGPNDAEAMCTGDWDLTLFTCTWGGAERITLRLLRYDK